MHRTIQKKLDGMSSDRILRMFLNYEQKDKEVWGNFWLEGFCFVIPITGLNRPNDDDGEGRAGRV
jgi:hypothetical protein